MNYKIYSEVITAHSLINLDKNLHWVMGTMHKFS